MSCIFACGGHYEWGRDALKRSNEPLSSPTRAGFVLVRLSDGVFWTAYMTVGLQQSSRSDDTLGSSPVWRGYARLVNAVTPLASPVSVPQHNEMTKGTPSSRVLPVPSTSSARRALQS